MDIIVNKEDFFDTYKWEMYANKSWKNYSHLFPIKASDKLASVVADLLTDGSVDIRKRLKSKYYGYILFCSRFKYELMNFNKRIKDLFGVKGKLKEDWGRYHYGRSKVCVVLNSTITRILSLCGVINGNKTNKPYNLPIWVINGEKSIQSAFLKRSFTCEGSISFEKASKRWTLSYCMYKLSSLSQNNKTYLNDLKLLLRNFGIITSKIYLEDRYKRGSDCETIEGYSFKIRDKKSILNFNKYIGFDIGYKKNRLQRASKEVTVNPK